jgi:hypothetical protein
VESAAFRLGRRHGWTLVAGAVVLVAYLVPLRAMPKAVFWHPDEGAKFIALASIRVGAGGLQYELPYAGMALDPELRFYPGRTVKGDLFPKRQGDGQVGFRWPVLFPLLSKPLLGAFGFPGLYVLPLLGGWLTALLAGLIADRHAPPLGPAAVLLVGFATPVAFYSFAFLEHTLAAAFLMVAVSVLLVWPHAKWTILALVTCLTLAVALRLDTLPLAAAVILATLSRGGRAPATRGGSARGRLVATVTLSLVAIVAVLLLAPDRYRSMLTTLPGSMAEQVDKLRFVVPVLTHVFLGSPGREVWSVDRPELWAAFGAVAVLLVAPWLHPWRPRLEPVITIAALAVLFEFTLHVALTSPPFLARQGAIAIAPYVAVAGYAIHDAWRRGDVARRRLASAGALAAAFAFLGLLAVRVNFDGSYQVGLDGGARYLLGIYPLGVLLTLLGLAAYRESDRPAWARSGFTVLVAGMMLVAAVVEIRGVQRVYDSRALLARWERAMPATPEPVVTDVWWLPAVLAPYYVSHAMYVVDPTVGLRDFVAPAAERGLRELTFASNQKPTDDRLQVEAGGIRVLSTRFVEGLYVARIAILR